MVLAESKNSHHNVLQTMLLLPGFGQDNRANQKVPFSVQHSFCLFIETKCNLANHVFEIIYLLSAKYPEGLSSVTMNYG